MRENTNFMFIAPLTLRFYFYLNRHFLFSFSSHPPVSKRSIASNALIPLSFFGFTRSTVFDSVAANIAIRNVVFLSRSRIVWGNRGARDARDKADNSLFLYLPLAKTTG